MVESGNQASQENWEDYKKYGFDLYPERRQGQSGRTSSLSNKLSSDIRKTKCEKAVYNAIKRNPVIQLLMGALKQKGCPVDIKRNFACETCDAKITGGFDQEYNQIVICSNESKRAEITLIHELIHMYDYCTAAVDFRNLEHLACTEIRAANLTHCSFLSSLTAGQSSLINIKKTHQYCVKMIAAKSMMLSRNLTFEEALSKILKVFDKCYNDLEPLGRRVRRKSEDPLMAYNEARQIGVCTTPDSELL